MKPGQTSRLVYSTDTGRTCPACRQALDACLCKAPAPAVNEAQAKAESTVRVSRETKGRGGKAVTLVKGITLGDAALQTLGKRLKSACGSGGTTKDGVIEVQGDHVDRVVAALKAEGWLAKRSGG
jgi:translation initiation factor 1